MNVAIPIGDGGGIKQVASLNNPPGSSLWWNIEDDGIKVTSDNSLWNDEVGSGRGEERSVDQDGNVGELREGGLSGSLDNGCW